jgi:hypothetical protein
LLVFFLLVVEQTNADSYIFQDDSYYIQEDSYDFKYDSYLYENFPYKPDERLETSANPIIETLNCLTTSKLIRAFLYFFQSTQVGSSHEVKSKPWTLNFCGYDFRNKSELGWLGLNHIYFLFDWDIYYTWSMYSSFLLYIKIPSQLKVWLLIRFFYESGLKSDFWIQIHSNQSDFRFPTQSNQFKPVWNLDFRLEIQISDLKPGWNQISDSNPDSKPDFGFKSGLISGIRIKRNKLFNKIHRFFFTLININQSFKRVK